MCPTGDAAASRPACGRSGTAGGRSRASLKTGEGRGYSATIRPAGKDGAARQGRPERYVREQPWQGRGRRRSIPRPGRFHEGLAALFREDPGAFAEYRRLRGTGALAPTTAELVAKQQRQPADVSEAEKAPYKSTLKALLAKRTAEASRELQELLRDVRGQAAWVDLVWAGEAAA